MTCEKYLIFLLTATFFCLNPSCSTAQKERTIIQLKDKDFKNLVDKTIEFSIPVLSVDEFHGSMADYLIFDTREQEEYKVSHIPNAIYLGYEKPEMDILEGQDKSKKILFYCSIGYRSEKIAELAKAKGFSEVYNLYGGIFEWTNRGYELETTSKTSTKNVHAYNRIWGKWINNSSYKKIY